MTEHSKDGHYEPSAKEQAALLASPAQTRFEYFVHKVAAWDEAWGLRYDDGAWVVLSDNEHDGLFALWPAAAYAGSAASGDFADAKPAPIPLRRLIDEMLPAWTTENVAVALFWLPTGQGIVVPAEMLRGALAEESSEYGDEYS